MVLNQSVNRLVEENKNNGFVAPNTDKNQAPAVVVVGADETKKPAYENLGHENLGETIRRNAELCGWKETAGFGTITNERNAWNIKIGGSATISLPNPPEVPSNQRLGAKVRSRAMVMTLSIYHASSGKPSFSNAVISTADDVVRDAGTISLWKFHWMDANGFWIGYCGAYVVAPSEPDDAEKATEEDESDPPVKDGDDTNGDGEPDDTPEDTTNDGTYPPEQKKRPPQFIDPETGQSIGLFALSASRRYATSGDGGSTWRVLTGPWTGNGVAVGSLLQNLVVSTSDNDIWVSHDLGGSWEQIVQNSTIDLALTNGGFETGTLAGWSTSGPAVADPNGSHSGAWCLGTDSSFGSGPWSAWQILQIPSENEAIVDAGGGLFNIAWWGFTFTGDKCQAKIEFLNASDSVISSYTFAEVSPTVWTEYTTQQAIPSLTRKIKVSLLAKNYVGAYANVRFDDVYVEAEFPESLGGSVKCFGVIAGKFFGGGNSGFLVVSEDYGDTWTPEINPFSGKNITRFSTVGSYLFASTADGYYAYTTGNGTWSSLYNFGDVSPVFTQDGTSTFGFGRSSGLVKKLVALPNSWVSLATPNPSGFLNGDTKNGVVYAVSDYGNAYFSEDNAASWTPATQEPMAGATGIGGILSEGRNIAWKSGTQDYFWSDDGLVWWVAPGLANLDLLEIIKINI